MQKLKPRSYEVKLLSVLLAVVLLLSVGNFISNRTILRDMEAEAERTAGERMGSAVTRFDEHFGTIHNHYITLYQSSPFQQYLTTGGEGYAQLELYRRAHQIFSNIPYVRSFILFFEGEKTVLTQHGVYDIGYFFRQYYQNAQYGADFWEQERFSRFTQRYYPEKTFAQTTFPGWTYVDLMPIAMKRYWSHKYMLLLLVDIGAVVRTVDPYYTEGLYIYGDGLLLYEPGDGTVPDVPLLADGENESFLYTGGQYVIQWRSPYNDLVYLKILPKTTVRAQVERSSLISISIAGLALLFAVVLAILAARRFARPVRSLVGMFEGNPEDKDDFAFIAGNVAALVKQQEKYLGRIAEQDNALSAFVFQSQLKNVYVHIDTAEPGPEENLCFLILYFQIHYRDGAMSRIGMEPKQITYMIKEMLHEILSRQFDKLLMFQLEENHFIAKLGLPEVGDIGAHIQGLMKILENEEEYAFFTVVQSRFFADDENIADIYAEVLRTAQYAAVADRNQFLIVGEDVQQGMADCFTPAQSRQLYELVSSHDLGGALALTDRVLSEHIESGISHISMVMLSNRIAGIIIRALEERLLRVPEPLREDAVFEKITGAGTAQEYRALMAGLLEDAIRLLVEAGEGDKADPMIRLIKTYVEENYTRDFSMQELSEAVGMSKGYLSTYFKNKTDTMLSEYIQKFRIQKAIALLEDSHVLVQDVGAMVGIENPNTFIRLFKKYVGISPGKYRKTMLGL